MTAIAIAIAIGVSGVAFYAWLLHHWSHDAPSRLSGTQSGPRWAWLVVGLAVTASIGYLMSFDGDAMRNMAYRLGWVVILTVSLEVVRRRHNRAILSRA